VLDVLIHDGELLAAAQAHPAELFTENEAVPALGPTLADVGLSE